MTQPCASLVAVGAKRLETRDWSSLHRGLIAIQAAKSYPAWARELALTSPFRELLPPGPLPLGAIVAQAELRDCIKVTSEAHGRELARGLGAPHEEAFGNFAPGRWVWVLVNVQVEEPPIPARGGLGLWQWRYEEVRSG